MPTTPAAPALASATPPTSRILTRDAPGRIADLIRLGVPFDSMEGEIVLAREGAHSVPRVLHAGGDATGRHIETTLLDAARDRGIPIREFSLAADAVVEDGAVRGLDVLDLATGARERIGCGHLVLATGGAGRLYRITTNSSVVTGDGVALGFRAGAEVMDMEFFQFHPTALRLPDAPPFLISEAVRGEGGVLLNAKRTAVHGAVRRRRRAGGAGHRGKGDRGRDAGDRR